LLQAKPQHDAAADSSRNLTYVWKIQYRRDCNGLVAAYSAGLSIFPITTIISQASRIPPVIFTA
jgi:hypothetical protein